VPGSKVNVYILNVFHQIENEYGSYEACDLDYMIRLRDIVRSIVGDAAVLYTTDGAGPSYLKCGKIESVYATVDFGTSKKLFYVFCAKGCPVP
jgi:beta-galactosidase